MGIDSWVFSADPARTRHRPSMDLTLLAHSNPSGHIVSTLFAPAPEDRWYVFMAYAVSSGTPGWSVELSLGAMSGGGSRRTRSLLASSAPCGNKSLLRRSWTRPAVRDWGIHLLRLSPLHLSDIRLRSARMSCVLRVSPRRTRAYASQLPPPDVTSHAYAACAFGPNVRRVCGVVAGSQLYDFAPEFQYPHGK